VAMVDREGRAEALTSYFDAHQITARWRHNITSPASRAGQCLICYLLFAIRFDRRLCVTLGCNVKPPSTSYWATFTESLWDKNSSSYPLCWRVWAAAGPAKANDVIRSGRSEWQMAGSKWGADRLRRERRRRKRA